MKEAQALVPVTAAPVAPLGFFSLLLLPFQLVYILLEFVFSVLSILLGAAGTLLLEALILADTLLKPVPVYAQLRWGVLLVHSIASGYLATVAFVFYHHSYTTGAFLLGTYGLRVALDAQHLVLPAKRDYETAPRTAWDLTLLGSFFYWLVALFLMPIEYLLSLVVLWDPVEARPLSGPFDALAADLFPWTSESVELAAMRRFGSAYLAGKMTYQHAPLLVTILAGQLRMRTQAAVQELLGYVRLAEQTLLGRNVLEAHIQAWWSGGEETMSQVKVRFAEAIMLGRQFTRLVRVSVSDWLAYFMNSYGYKEAPVKTALAPIIVMVEEPTVQAPPPSFIPVAEPNHTRAEAPSSPPSMFPSIMDFNPFI